MMVGFAGVLGVVATRVVTASAESLPGGNDAAAHPELNGATCAIFLHGVCAS